MIRKYSLLFKNSTESLNRSARWELRTKEDFLICETESRNRKRDHEGEERQQRAKWIELATVQLKRGAFFSFFLFLFFFHKGEKERIKHVSLADKRPRHWLFVLAIFALWFAELSRPRCNEDKTKLTARFEPSARYLFAIYSRNNPSAIFFLNVFRATITKIYYFSRCARNTLPLIASWHVYSSFIKIVLREIMTRM